MTQQIGTWRVEYRPGDWIVLSGPTSLVVLQPASGDVSDLVAVLWEQVLASATITDLAARLASYGVDTMPSFAALFWHQDGLRSLVRGDVALADLSTGATVAQGADVVTWSEVGLAGVDHVEIVLTGDLVDPAALTLPLVVGAVRASSVVLDARASALLSSPQDAVASAPEVLAPEIVTTPSPEPESLTESAAALDVPPSTEVDEVAAAGQPAGETEDEDTDDDTDDEGAAGDAAPTGAAAGIGVGAGAAGAFAGAAVLPGVPPISEGDGGALGTQGYLGTEAVAPQEADASPEPGAAQEPGTLGESSDPQDPVDDDELDDQPDTEPFDVARDFEDVQAQDAPADENESADTELMYLPPEPSGPADGGPLGDDAAPDEGVALEDDDENAHTELMYLPAAEQSLDPEQVVEDDDAWGVELTEEVVGVPAHPTQELESEVPEWPADPEVSGLDVEGGTAGGSLIMAVTCPRLHPNPPPAGFCRICGEAITRQGPRLVSRPVLARLRGPGGDTVDLDRPVRIGRAPSPDGDADQRLMTVMSPSQDISRTHLQVAPDGWQVIATDLHSTNGTLLVSSDDGMGPHPLTPGEPVVLELGAVLELGDGVTIVIDPPPDL